MQFFDASKHKSQFLSRFFHEYFDKFRSPGNLRKSELLSKIFLKLRKYYDYPPRGFTY